MSEFFDTQTLQCPGCKKLFTACEGPLCSCEEDMQDMLAEMRREPRLFGSYHDERDEEF